MSTPMMFRHFLVEVMAVYSGCLDPMEFATRQLEVMTRLNAMPLDQAAVVAYASGVRPNWKGEYDALVAAFADVPARPHYHEGWAVVL